MNSDRIKVGVVVRMKSGKEGEVTEVKFDTLGRIETVYVEFPNDPYFVKMGDDDEPYRIIGRPFNLDGIDEVLGA